MIVKYKKHITKRVDLVLVDGNEKILKPSVYTDPYEQPLAACELICYKLLNLLKEKGIDIKYPEVTPYVPDRFIVSNNNIRYMTPSVIIDYIVNHKNIKGDEIIDNIKVPGWIYYFDKWVGRLDSDTNLILSNNGEVMSIDYELSFPWVCGRPPVYKKLNDFDIKHNPMSEKHKDNNCLAIIKSLTDQEIWNSVTTNIPKQMIASSTLIGIWSGLCDRRDLLC